MFKNAYNVKTSTKQCFLGNGLAAQNQVLKTVTPVSAPNSCHHGVVNL